MPPAARAELLPGTVTGDVGILLKAQTIRVESIFGSDSVKNSVVM